MTLLGKLSVLGAVVTFLASLLYYFCSYGLTIVAMDQAVQFTAAVVFCWLLAEAAIMSLLYEPVEQGSDPEGGE